MFALYEQSRPLRRAVTKARDEILQSVTPLATPGLTSA